MDLGNSEGIGLVVGAVDGVGAVADWADDLPTPFQGLNLNGRITVASALLGDVLLGALLADGSQPSFAATPIAGEAAYCFGASTDCR